MKRTILAVVTAFALTGSMLLPLKISAQAGGAPAAKGGKGERKEGQERHPEIRQAIRHLQAAKDALREGAHDFQGHRVEALKHVDQALEECHKALGTDEK